MKKVRFPALARLLIEIFLILILAELLAEVLVNTLRPALPLPGSGFAAATLDIVLLALLSLPLLAWRLSHYTRELHRNHKGVVPESSHQLTRHALLAGVLFFLAGTALSIFMARQISKEQQMEALNRFEAQVNLLEEVVAKKFENPLQALKGLVAIHALDAGFSRQRFRNYWAARDFLQDFPGVRGFGYMARVAPDRIDQFIAAQRRDQAPDFRIKTLGPTNERYIITLVEPIEKNQEALGLDIGSERTRLNAAQTAARTGRPTLSGVITLVQDGRQGPGFVLLLPVYRPGARLDTSEARLAHHLGFVYSPLVAEELFQPLLLQTLGQLHFDLETRTAEGISQRVFDSEHYVQDKSSKPSTALFTSSRHFLIAGVEFRLSARSTPTFEATLDIQRAWQIGMGGSVLSALLAFTLWLLVLGRARAEGLALKLTSELRKLAAIAQRTNDAVIITDTRGQITWVNESYASITGYTAEESYGHKPGALLQCPETDPTTIAELSEKLLKREPCRVEILNRHKTGHLYWVDLEIKPLSDTAGHFSGFMAIKRDVTAWRESQARERAQLEQLNAALRETEALMSTIHAHAIVSEAGRDGRITRVNDAFCQISGYARDELIGQDHRIVNSGQHEQAFWTGMWQAIGSGRPWRGQICNRAKNGSLYWVDSIISPFTDAHGKIQKYVSIRFDITEARNSQMELAKERLRLKHTLEGTNVGTWEINLLTGENRIDERWAAILGYRLDELLPMNMEKWRHLLHPDDGQAADQQLRDYLQGRVPIFEVERRLRHKNGQWVWVLSRGTVSTRLPDGRVEWISGTHMDISERRLMHAELEHRNNLMSAIMANMPGGLSAFDADLKLVARNQLFSELLEFPDELFDRPVVRFEDIIRFNAERGEYGPGDVDGIVLPIIERARHPSPHLFERVRPDGKVLEVRGMPMPGGGFVTIYTDITQRKQAEKEARRSDEMLRQAIDTLDEAFVIYDDHDRLLICNQRYRDTYPVAAEVMKPGTTFEDIIRYGAERNEYAQAIGRTEDWIDERMRQHRSGNSDIVQELGDGRFLRIVERRTSDGYTVGFRIDITDLMRARIAAEEASRSKSQFLANMSHEIRTPMNAILGMLSLLHNTELSTRQLDYANKAEGAAKSLLELLNDILDFSKIEAGKMTLETASFRIDHMLRDLSVILSSNTGKKDIEVLFDIDPRLPAVLVGDSLRLKQVLINLGGNAIKFTEHGTVVLRIGVLDLPPGKASLEFSVRDTGIGIARENLQRIFEGFSQAEASTTRRFGGTGLGLAISARLVNLMSSRIEVESAIGEGSNFHFKVMLGLTDDAAPMARWPQQDELHALRVLVIDDNPMARQVMQGLAQSLGWTVDLADSGAQALATLHALLARGQPMHDVIFVDRQMPDLDGGTTCRRIGALLQERCPVLIMVTAHGQEMFMQRSEQEQARINGFLVKPATPSMLLDAVLEARASQTASPVHRRPAGRRLQGMRVLIVEDNKINQQVAQELLQGEGARITLADNGREGVQAVMAARVPFDVVLMDVQMPVMDGYAATRAIRDALKFDRLPIIAMTANAMERDRQDALDSGMNAHIGKPFNLDDLVRTMLEQSRFVPAGVAAEPPPQASTPATADTPATWLAGQAEFPEFDLAAALQRLEGNADILHMILQTFARTLPRYPLDLASMLTGSEPQEALRLLHTLKGAAATVGANRLASVSALGEQRLQQQDRLSEREAKELRTLVEAEIHATGLALQAILASWPAPPAEPDAAAPSVEPDRETLCADLRELKTLLRNSDLHSLEVYSRLRERHAPALRKQLDTLDQAMADLDLSTAEQLCASLLDRYTA